MASRLYRKLSAIIRSSAALRACSAGVFSLGILSLGLLSLGTWAPGALAADTETRTYPLPDHGTVQLTVPTSWKDDVQQRGEGLPPTISFTPATGEDFQVMITPVLPPHPGMSIPPLDAIRANLEQSLTDVRPRAKERKIVIEPLSAPGIEGYYYSVTDKAPKPGEFRLMTQAEARAEGMVVAMTVLSNDDTGRVRAQALAVLKSARHKASENSVAISKVAAGYEVTVPVSRLILTLAEPDLDQESGPGQGAASNPRYFLFRDRSQGLIISGWFEPAESYHGLKPFWEGETETWKKNKMPEPQNVAFKKIAGWDAIAYDIKMPVANTANAHIRAEWVQAGTWIDIHLSMTASLPSDKVHAKLEEILKHIKVREKGQ